MESVPPVSALLLYLLPARHLGNCDLNSQALGHGLHRKLLSAGTQALVEVVQRPLALLQILNHPRPAVADDTVAVQVAGIALRQYSFFPVNAQ